MRVIQAVLKSKVTKLISVGRQVCIVLLKAFGELQKEKNCVSHMLQGLAGMDKCTNNGPFAHKG